MAAADDTFCVIFPNFRKKGMVCQQTILMKYHALFVILEKAAKLLKTKDGPLWFKRTVILLKRNANTTQTNTLINMLKTFWNRYSTCSHAISNDLNRVQSNAKYKAMPNIKHDKKRTG